MENLTELLQDLSTSLTKRKDNTSSDTASQTQQTIDASQINPDEGIALFSVIKSDLDNNDFLDFLKFMATKFRTKVFYQEKSAEWNLAHLTFRMAKEHGYTKKYFRKCLEDFIINFQYTVAQWQPNHILKLSEQPRLYPRQWVMSKMLEDPHIWEKLKMYEVGNQILYCWKWEDVPLPVFVPKQAKPDYSRQQPEPEKQEISDEKPSQIVTLVRENLKLKVQLDDLRQQIKMLQRHIKELDDEKLSQRRVPAEEFQF
jgi:hypothetical protein